MLAREMLFRVSVSTALLSVRPPTLPTPFPPPTPTRLPSGWGDNNEQNRHGPQPPWRPVTRGNRRDVACYATFRRE